MLDFLRCISLLLPFPFYYTLWTRPQKWVDLCRDSVDPSRRMTQSTPKLQSPSPLPNLFIKHLKTQTTAMLDFLRNISLILPFPFYFALWNYPQKWVDLCGHGVDPCRRMAQVSHALKAVQILALLSVSRFVFPPWYCVVLFCAGQFLNFKVYQLLGEAGTYYGIRFGKSVPWVTEFPFGYVKDPQYTGSVMSLLALLCWVPFKYVFVWILGYVFMVWVEFKEDPSTRAKPKC
ncbi:hypothetical protein LUZ60_017541 [Juncus effusus]|nr:hypothetical protein LUZ60_017541 [Juncus effusus]